LKFLRRTDFRSLYQHGYLGPATLRRPARNPSCAAAAVLLFLAVAGGCGCSGPGGDAPVSLGRFSSDHADVRLLSDGRRAQLLRPFAYTDGAGKPWEAPEGEMIDGATIPQVFWSIVGGPYEGKYRFASIVHDRYCRAHDGRRWQDVHRMFYEACVTGGTDPKLAKLMYAAVYHFGPRWGERAKGTEDLALLIAPERARIAAALDSTEPLGATQPTTAATREVGVRGPQQRYRDAVLSPGGPRARTRDRSAVLEKWDRIRDLIRENEAVELRDIEDVR
jgi:hypothetical protein